jgi:hypothetical protein
VFTCHDVTTSVMGDKDLYTVEVHWPTVAPEGRVMAPSPTADAVVPAKVPAANCAAVVHAWNEIAATPCVAADTGIPSVVTSNAIPPPRSDNLTLHGP